MNLNNLSKESLYKEGIVVGYETGCIDTLRRVRKWLKKQFSSGYIDRNEQLLTFLDRFDREC